MCGVVAVIGAYQNGFSQAEQNIFRDMLYVDTLRGWDSTGVFMVDPLGNVRIRKAAVDGPTFLRTEQWKALNTMSWSKGMFMVGHNRAATRGTVSDENAHPFVVDDKIVLVQNGTYFGDHKHHKDVEVDSEALAHVISETEDVEEALKKINAAYALVWYNTETTTLHVIRNNHRPLYMAKTEDDTYLLASEQETIWWACGRNKVKLKGVPKMLEEHELHTFKIEKKQYVHETKKLECSFRGSYSGWSDDEHDYMAYWRQRYGHMDHTTETHNVGNVKNDLTIYDYIHKKNTFISYAMDSDEVSTTTKHLDSMRTANKDVVVELGGYLPMELPSETCRRWIVYGDVMRIDNEDPTPLVYTIMTHVEENQVLDYVTAGPYLAKMACGHVTHTINPGIKQYQIVTQFCTHFEAIQEVKEVEEETVH